MKKFITFLLMIVLCLSFVVGVNAEENESNIIDEVNSGFESATKIEDTKWFRLVDAFGDSKSKNLVDIQIKTDGGNSGSNYLSMTGNKSWYSPCLNLYPFFKEAGPGEYIIAYYLRCEKKVPESFMIRGLKTDMDPASDDEEITGFPSLIDKGSSNYFRSFPGTVTDNGGWVYFESDIIEVTEDNIKDDHHNWWFVLGSMVNVQFTVDIDDFVIIKADDYESPNAIGDTDISYLTPDVMDNALEAIIPSVTEAPPSATQKPADPVTVTNETDITLYVCLGIGLVSVVAIVPMVIIKLKKKK